MKFKLLILTGVVLLIAVAGVVWVAISGWPPVIIRDREYRELLNNFHQAQPKERVPGAKDSDMDGWDFQVGVSEGQTTVQVKASGRGIVRVKYPDEDDGRKLYEYVDYTHVRRIRMAQNTIYVYWVETLLHTDEWLMAYDLVNRGEIVRRKIDPDDLLHSL